jgi:cytochrome c
MNGITLMHSADPELETKNIIELKDANGKAFIREFAATAKKGSGWVDYMWPKPGEKSPSKKVSYVKGAKMPTGEVVIVGAGIYLN